MKKKAPTADRKQVARAIIVWFEGFGGRNDQLKPSTATWEAYGPLEQMRALKAAEAAIAAIGAQPV